MELQQYNSYRPLGTLGFLSLFWFQVTDLMLCTFEYYIVKQRCESAAVNVISFLQQISQNCKQKHRVWPRVCETYLSLLLQMLQLQQMRRRKQRWMQMLQRKKLSLTLHTARPENA